MVKLLKSLLLTVDPTMKQFLLYLQRSTNLIIEDLDDVHVLIDENQKEWVERQVEKRVDRNIDTAAE
jgi:hypothetical protein